jgi:hypothetical protein
MLIHFYGLLQAETYLDLVLAVTEDDTPASCVAAAAVVVLSGLAQSGSP